jgi:hypothetical protein
MNRRGFLQRVGGGSVALLIGRSDAAPLKFNEIYSIRCLGNVNGPRYLDGRTGNGTVALVDKLVKPFFGTKWQLVNGGNGAVAFRCKGNAAGPVWLDGRTADGTVGLAPKAGGTFTGTRWQMIEVDGGVTLKCLGNVEGPRWLDGRTGNGSVGLAKTTDPPFTGTKWEIKIYPRCIDEPCPLPW